MEALLAILALGIIYVVGGALFDKGKETVKSRKLGSVDTFRCGNAMKCAINRYEFSIFSDTGIEQYRIPRNSLHIIEIDKSRSQEGNNLQERKVCVVLEWINLSNETESLELTFDGTDAFSQACTVVDHFRSNAVNPNNVL